MSRADHRDWISRIQQQGLTPGLLEDYIAAGWSLHVIATRMRLDVDDLLAAAERWSIRIAHTAD
jgi:hypothetical protein